MNIQKIHGQAGSLAKDAEILVDNLADHDLKAKDRIALPFLAADAGTLAYEYAKLRVDIIRIHEKRQRDAINSNG